MTVLFVGERVRVNYVDKSGSAYVFHVEVRTVAERGRFLGRVEGIFTKGSGEVIGSAILDLNGQEMTFGTGGTSRGDDRGHVGKWRVVARGRVSGSM